MAVSFACFTLLHGLDLSSTDDQPNSRSTRPTTVAYRQYSLVAARLQQHVVSENFRSDVRKFKALCLAAGHRSDAFTSGSLGRDRAPFRRDVDLWSPEGKSATCRRRPPPHP
jgi:hypothetical protein